MMQLEYGHDQVLAIDDLAGHVMACGTPPQVALDDVVAAVAAALHDPLDFPGVARCVVPGDRVAIALTAAVPNAAAIVAGVVQSLIDADIPADHISLVVAAGYDDLPSLTQQIAATHREGITVSRHDPRDVRRLAYLAASRDAEPIYVNRTLFDADLAIPIGCVEVEGSFGYHGIRGGIFPDFADKSTIDRIQGAATDTDDEAHRHGVSELEEACWLMGTRLTLQVLPGKGHELIHVVAGDVDAVTRAGREFAAAAWQTTVPHRAELVIAALVGGGEHQTWHNVARALAAAASIVEDDGAIAICSQLADPPGIALLRVMAGDLLDDAADAYEHFEEDEALEAYGEFAGRDDASQVESPSDSRADISIARQLRRTLESTRVYLLSELDEETVESLGMAYVADPSEIQNLCRRHHSTILLANAQHVSPAVQRTAVG